MFGKRRRDEAFQDWLRIVELGEAAVMSLERLADEWQAKLETVDGRLVRIEQALQGTLGQEIQRAGYRIGP